MSKQPAIDLTVILKAHHQVLDFPVWLSQTSAFTKCPTQYHEVTQHGRQALSTHRRPHSGKQWNQLMQVCSRTAWMKQWVWTETLRLHFAKQKQWAQRHFDALWRWVYVCVGSPLWVSASITNSDKCNFEVMFISTVGCICSAPSNAACLLLADAHRRLQFRCNPTRSLDIN